MGEQKGLYLQEKNCRTLHRSFIQIQTTMDKLQRLDNTIISEPLCKTSEHG